MGACASACVKEHDSHAVSKQKASVEQENNVLGMSDSVVSVDTPRHKATHESKSPNSTTSDAATSESQVEEAPLGADGVMLDMTPTAQPAVADEAPPSSQPQQEPPLPVSVPAIVAKLELQTQKAGSPRPITLHNRTLSAAMAADIASSPRVRSPVANRPTGTPPPKAQDSFAILPSAAHAAELIAAEMQSPTAPAAPSPERVQTPAAAASPKPQAKTPVTATKSATASPAAAKPFNSSPAAALAKTATPPRSADKLAPEVAAPGFHASSGPRTRQPFAAAAPTANSLSRQRSAAQVAKEDAAIALRASSLASFLPAPAKPLNRTESFEAKLAAKKAGAKKKYKKTNSGKKLVK